MEHLIQLAISVEDEKIVERIEKTAEEQIIQTISEKVESVIANKRGWYGSKEKDYTPLKNMVSEQITKILDENKDFILTEASKILADKLARSKAGKELLQELKEN